MYMYIYTYTHTLLLTNRVAPFHQPSNLFVDVMLLNILPTKKLVMTNFVTRLSTSNILRAPNEKNASSTLVSETRLTLLLALSVSL